MRLEKVIKKNKLELEKQINNLEGEIEFLKQYNRDTTLLENILELNKKYYSVFLEMYKTFRE